MELSGCGGSFLRRCSLLPALLLFLGSLLLFRLTYHSTSGHDVDDINTNNDIHTPLSITLSGLNRKLLGRAVEPKSVAVAVSVGVGVGEEKCGRSDIVINQGATGPLPNGIPSYTVEIMNQCVSGCNISTIHLSCGMFSSATIINPKVFKRLAYNDCLVNDGRPLPCGAALSFQYASTFSYPLSVASLAC